MTDRSELEAKIYDSLAAFNFTACWDVLRLAQARQYLAEHLAADLSAAVLPALADRAPLLTDSERQFLTFALDQAAEEMSLADGFTDEDEAALEKFRRMADEAQQAAWPSESQWRVEIYDPGVEQWMPFGSLTTKPEAERRLALVAEQSPKWRHDGTDIRHRIVRTTVTYTVEPKAQR